MLRVPPILTVQPILNSLNRKRLKDEWRAFLAIWKVVWLGCLLTRGWRPAWKGRKLALTEHFLSWHFHQLSLVNNKTAPGMWFLRNLLELIQVQHAAVHCSESTCPLNTCQPLVKDPVPIHLLRLFFTMCSLLGESSWRLWLSRQVHNHSPFTHTVPDDLCPLPSLPPLKDGLLRPVLTSWPTWDTLQSHRLSQVLHFPWVPVAPRLNLKTPCPHRPPFMPASSSGHSVSPPGIPLFRPTEGHLLPSFKAFLDPRRLPFTAAMKLKDAGSLKEKLWPT